MRFIIILCFGLVAPSVAQNQFPPIRVQLPTFGVSVDADGVIRNAEFRAAPKLARQRRAARLAKAEPHFALSDCRKISLSHLETALLENSADAKAPDDVMLHLAGLYQIEYVFIYPDEQDVVIAGPAGGWINDPAGRAVNAETGHPVILLEDLLVALRAFRDPVGAPDAMPWIGCSIDPTAEGLKRLARFRQSLPNQISQANADAVAQEMARNESASLGLATVNVFGIAPDTHMAAVLVEADYRMKLIGLGLEPPPVKMATFFSSLRRPPRAMQRWWFTPDKKRLVATPDGLAIQFVGAGVELSTEPVTADPNGNVKRQPTSSSSAARRYAASFTKKYAEIAKASPIYWQLRNMVDLLVAAAWLHQTDVDQHLKHAALGMIDESAIDLHGWPVPRQAQCVAHAIWKGNRLICMAGGGVSISVQEALYFDNVESKPNFDRQRAAMQPAGDRWWWD